MANVLVWQPELVGFDAVSIWQTVRGGALRLGLGAPVSAPHDDAVLMERVARGDAGAYRELLERHLRGMHGFVYRMLGNQADAEEVCQESFLRLWKQASSYVPRAKP